MAPNLDSPANSHNRFSSGFCSTSMAPTPASGFSFDPLPHTQRYVQSSTSSNGDTAFQIQQFYMQQSRQHAASQNTGSAPAVDIQRASNEADSTVAELPLEDPQLGQALQSFVQENMSAGPIPASLMRYHSAPSSMLGSLTGMGNAIMNHDGELDQFLSNSTLHLDSKEDLKPMDNSHGFENRCLVPGMGAGAMDFLSNCNGGFVSSPYQRVRSVTDNNNNSRPQIGMDADGVPFPRASDALSESGRGSALELPSSYNLRSSFATDTAHLENGNGLARRMPVSNNTRLESGNGIVRGVPISKNSLMRHSSSPAGLLSQLNDDQERHMLGSSSGNSSEEGSYDRQDSKSLLAGYPWDEAGNVMVRSPHGSNAARKRIRDLEEKCYAASTVMESQKGDAMEHGVLGNYFGTSPENTFFTDKLSPDSIPCRTRAKRGCATHPRSIAERVRRTKISERMKKLQELVPNMDKQTNTAEMLDEAVEYVKDLQRQVQELTEGRSNCKCSCGRPKETSSR